MSFALGWFAQNVTLSVAFVLLGAIYGGAVLSALWARTLASAAQQFPDSPVAG
jgi:formate/nitrite transporter FocA (FNT family)